jgi:hypothetical protein
MEDGRYTKIDDFEKFGNEQKRWANQVGYWMQRAAWPLHFVCVECEQNFDLHQNDLNGSHIDVSYTKSTGQPRNAYLPTIIECKFCKIENVYNLVKFKTATVIKGAK